MKAETIALVKGSRKVNDEKIGFSRSDFLKLSEGATILNFFKRGNYLSKFRRFSLLPQRCARLVQRGRRAHALSTRRCSSRDRIRSIHKGTMGRASS